MSQKTSHGTFASYTVGFVLSVALTLEAYFLVMHHVLSYWILLFTIIALAVTQLMVQLYFFLHLGSESKPRWRLMTFLFAVIIVTIIVGGSIWIMNNLDYHHDKFLNPSVDSKAIIKDEGIH